jgi:molybdopterin biosynthesis enzyme
MQQAYQWSMQLTWVLPLRAGAPVPSGADAVVQVEDTARTPGDPSGRREVVINKQVAAGTDIRPIGSDIRWVCECV